MWTPSGKWIVRHRLFVLTVTLIVSLVGLFAYLGLSRRATDEVTLTFLSRSEVDGFRVAHFELRIPPDRQISVPPISNDGIVFLVPSDKRFDNIRWQSMRLAGIANGDETWVPVEPFAVEFENPKSPPMRIITITRTANSPRFPAGYGRGDFKGMYGPNTNILITVVEPDQPQWRLEFKALQSQSGRGAWGWKLKRLWKTKRWSALKSTGPIRTSIRVQSELMTNAYASKPSITVKGSLDNDQLTEQFPAVSR